MITVSEAADNNKDNSSHLQQSLQSCRGQLRVDPPEQPHQMSHHVVHVDAGEEKLIKNRRAEILRLELLLHPDEAGDQTVEEGVLQHNCNVDTPHAAEVTPLPRKDAP